MIISDGWGGIDIVLVNRTLLMRFVAQNHSQLSTHTYFFRFFVNAYQLFHQDQQNKVYEDQYTYNKL